VASIRCVSEIVVQGRRVSVADLEYIRALRIEYSQWSRQRLSEHLVQHWQWRNEAGRLKDMATRTLLLKLQARNLIDLPPSLRRGGNNQRRALPPPDFEAQPELFGAMPASIVGSLSAIGPVRLSALEDRLQRRRATELLRRFHYRGYNGAVGENVQYLATDRFDRELAVMVFGAAAWKVAPRDRFIGWSSIQRRARLRWIVNQQRFLILPWVKTPHLASHILGLALRRLIADWQRRYGHPVWLVETFVEEHRFAATSYQAAGWMRLGQTTGRTRQDRRNTLRTPLKGIWVKPLHARFRQLLCNTL
jgi:Domain of unknown function (DUF4338)